MTDIASLSVNVTNDGIDDTRARLNALATAADRTALSVYKAETSVAKAALARSKASQAAVEANMAGSASDLAATNAAVAAARAALLLASANEAESTALRATAMAAAEAHRETDALQNSAQRLRAAIDPLGYAQNKYNQEIAEYNILAQRGIITATELAQAHALAAGRLAHSNQLMNSMDSTPGGRAANLSNVVAQFQDIGVTAQMGMSPMTIALQQGTQLSQALLMMEKPLEGIGKALLALISPLSLLTLGLVAAAAAAIQFINWPAVGAAALRALASVLVEIAPYVLYLGTALLIAFSPQIIAGIVSLTISIAKMGVQALVAAGKMALGWAIAAGPFTLIVLGIAAIIGALVLFRDQVTKIFGRDIVGDIQNAANYIIGAFVGAFEGIKASWSMLPAAMGDLAIQAVNNVIAGVEGMINASRNQIAKWMIDLGTSLPMGFGNALISSGAAMSQGGGVDFRPIDNPNAGAAAQVGNNISDAIKKAQGYNYVGAAIGFVQHAAEGAADAVRGLADSLGKNSKADKAAAKEAERQAKRYTVLTNDARQYIAQKNLEIASLGMNREAADALREEQEMLNKAQNDGIDLSPKQRAEIHSLAAEMAAATEKAKVWTEWYNFGKSTFSSFISDIKSGIKDASEALQKLPDDLEGKLSAKGGSSFSGAVDKFRASIAAGAPDFDSFEERVDRIISKDPTNLQTIGDELLHMADNARQAGSAWGIVGDAAANALDKIADKVLGMAADGIFDLIFNSIVGGITGGGVGGGMGGSSGLGSAIGGAVSGIFNADGGGYTGSGPRSGGLDGRGGFLGMLHPQETVSDHTRGQGMGVVVQNIDQRSSGAPVKTEISRGRNGEKIIRNIIRDEVTQARRRGAPGF